MMATASERLASLRASRSPFGSRTDIGCVRDHNEDSLVVKPPLYVVADGMGGHAAGEIASEIAVQVIADRAPNTTDGQALSEAVEAANEEILAAVRDGHGRQGMGTTVTAAILEKERLIIAQVGDSRAYLLHQGTLQQLTRDHSLVADMVEAGRLTAEEARVHPSRSVITRALGSVSGTKPDIYELNVEAGDRLLICSDGLTSMLLDAQIEEILARVNDPQRCAAQLVNEAITAGGFDNVTVVVVDVVGLAEVRRKKMARKTKRAVAFVLLLFVALFAAAAYGLHYWVNTAAYLTENDGKVAVYQGVFGSFLGVSFSNLVEITDINVDDLTPGVASRLTEYCIAVDTLDAAYALIDQYREDLERSSLSTTDTDTTTDTDIDSDVDTTTSSTLTTDLTTTTTTDEAVMS